MYWLDDTSDRDPTTRRVRDFMMDSDADLASLPRIGIPGVPQPDDTFVSLPVEKGSSAMSIKEGNLYFLNSNNEWQKPNGL